MLDAERENRARRLNLSGGKNAGMAGGSENPDDDIPETNPDVEFLGTNAASCVKKNPSALQCLIRNENTPDL